MSEQRSVVAPAYRGANALNNPVFWSGSRHRPPPPTLGRCLNGWCPQLPSVSPRPSFVPRPPYSLRDWKPNQVRRGVKTQHPHGVPPQATCDTCRPEPILIVATPDAPPATSASATGALQIEWCSDDGCCVPDYERQVRWALRQVPFNNVTPVIRSAADQEQVVAVVSATDPQRLIGQKTPSGLAAFEFTLALGSQQPVPPVEEHCNADSLLYTLTLYEPLTVDQFTVALKLIHGSSSCDVVLTVRGAAY